MISNQSVVVVLKHGDTAFDHVRDASTHRSSCNHSNDKAVRFVHTFYLLYVEIFQSNSEEELIIFL